MYTCAVHVPQIINYLFIPKDVWVSITALYVYIDLHARQKSKVQLFFNTLKMTSGSSCALHGITWRAVHGSSFIPICIDQATSDVHTSVLFTSPAGNGNHHTRCLPCTSLVCLVPCCCTCTSCRATVYRAVLMLYRVSRYTCALVQ